MMENLDLKDRKILHELDMNSRQPFNKIGKKVGLSKDSVNYRVNKLKEKGMIKHFHTVVDVGKLGFISFRLYLKFQNTTTKKEEEIIDFFKNKGMVIWIVSIETEYDLGMCILTKSVKEMNGLWKEFLEKYVNYVDKKWITIFTKVSYYPRVYFLDENNNKNEQVFITEPDEVSLEKKDLELLKLMAPDSRIPVVDLAEKLGLTPKTVTSRIKSLEEKGVIIGYRTMFDLGKLGYKYFKLHMDVHNSTQKRINDFKDYIKKHPNVIYDNEVLGGDDLEIEIQTKSLEHFRSIVNEIRDKFVDIIKKFRHMTFYKEHKFLFFPVYEE